MMVLQSTEFEFLKWKASMAGFYLSQLHYALNNNNYNISIEGFAMLEAG